MNNRKVVVLGASFNPHRASNQAVERLLDQNYQVIPVNPALDTLYGLPVVKSLQDVEGPVDTLSIYLSEERSNSVKDEVLKLKPKRILFNPGAENHDLYLAAEQEGIEVENACTLVLLSIGAF